MNRPKKLDLSSVVGKFTTQIRVGQFDLQFTFDEVDFAVSSPVKLFRAGKQIGYWEEGKWPDVTFYKIMNTEVSRCEIKTDRLIVIEFANGIEMHLGDDSYPYECMTIQFKGDPSLWIVE